MHESDKIKIFLENYHPATNSFQGHIIQNQYFIYIVYNTNKIPMYDTSYKSRIVF